MVRDHNNDHDDSTLDIDRRQLLYSVGALGAASMAGCLDDTSDGGDNDDDTDPDDLRSVGLQLLEEGFEEEGVEPPYEARIISNTNPERVQWSQLVQQTLNNTEFFELEFDQFEWNTYTSMVLSETSDELEDIAALGWSAGFDPDAYVNYLLHSSKETPACCNVNHYNSEEIDQLIDDGLEELDTQERIKIYEDLQRLVVQESPLTYVQFGKSMHGYRTEAIENWKTAPFDGSMFTCVFDIAADTAITFKDPRGDGELVGAISANPKNFDPTAINDTTSSKVNALTYESLVDTDDDGKAQPMLATDWEQTGDLTFRFNLREGVEFHNGETLTADHVKGSFERYEETVREADVYQWYGDSTVVDDLTIDVELSKPYAPFLNSIAGVPIVPMAAIDGDLKLENEPVGTGPYQHGEFEPDALYRVNRYDNHWFGGSDNMPSQPEPESITFRVITESSVRRQALESGDVDVSSPPLSAYADLEEMEGIGTDVTTAGGFDFLIPPLKTKPFTNAKVRRGLSLLIPRQQIIDSVYSGLGEPAYGPISPVAAQFALENEELVSELTQQ